MNDSELRLLIEFSVLVFLSLYTAFRNTKLVKDNKNLEEINNNLTIEIQNLMHENSQLKTKSNYEELAVEVKRLIAENNMLKNQGADTN